MLVHGQERASVMSAIACRASLLLFWRSFWLSRRAQPRWLLVPTLLLLWRTIGAAYCLEQTNISTLKCLRTEN